MDFSISHVTNSRISTDTIPTSLRRNPTKMDTIDGAIVDLHPVFDPETEPHYEIAQCKEDPNKSLIISPRINGVYIGVVDLEKREWYRRPLRFSYSKFHEVWTNFRGLSRVYSRILDDEIWNSLEMRTSIVINDDDDELVLQGGGIFTEFGVKSSDDGEEACVTVGEDSIFVVEFEGIVKALSDMTVDYRLTDHAWNLIRNHHPISINALRSMELQTRPRPPPATDSEPEDEEMFLGIVEIDG